MDKMTDAALCTCVLPAIIGIINALIESVEQMRLCL